MSVLDILAAIPCINSRKVADTIMRELAGKGYAITLYRRAPDQEYPHAPEGHIGEINVPPVCPLPDEEQPA